MKRKVIINSKTSGKFKREVIDGRSHIVTTMMPIRGDITMNDIFYPDEEVESSFMQLNMLPAPNGHPKVNGVNVPAFHPVANNKHNIGGFLRNPRKKGKRVFVDFLLDEEVANRSEEGKETIRRIENNERIGVSTGLGITQVINKTGSDDFGKKYTKSGSGFVFDHVATLLNEEAAGKHAGTELVLNEKGEEISMYFADWKVNELSCSQIMEQIHSLLRRQTENDDEKAYVWPMEVYPDSRTFVYSLEEKGEARKLFRRSYAVDQNDNIALDDDKTEVIIDYKDRHPKPETETETEKEVSEMDKSKLVLAIIGNSNNKYTVADNDKLMAMSDADLCSIVGQSVDVEQAKALLTNSGNLDLAGYEEFKANEAEFKAFQKAQSEALAAKIDHIVANSKFTAEMLAGKSEAELDVINEMIQPEKPAVRAPQQASTKTTATNSQEAVVDYN